LIAGGFPKLRYLRSQSFISQFPTIANQFETAKPVRNWISTNRLHIHLIHVWKTIYILPHASGFIDPIFLPGLIQTLQVLVSLAALILKAIASNDFSTKHFAALERLQQEILIIAIK